MNTQRYNAVLFDMDGTVLNTLTELTTSLQHVFAAHQLPLLPAEKVRSCLGYGYEVLIERAAGPAVPQEEKAVLTEEFKTYYSSHCHGCTQPYAGIPAVLRALRQNGCATAIVSNKGQAAVTALHTQFFQDLVSFSLGESPCYRKKPAPDMIFAALRRLGCAPQDAVYVGDSEVDYETACRAGTDSILVSWGFRDRPFLEALSSTYLADTPQELARILLPNDT